MGYRPEFEAALRQLARLSEAMKVRGLPRPILVGGGATEFYSRSAINTGDFDLCTPWQDELEEEMQAQGFIKPSGPGQFTKGWIHPDLKLAYEIVAGTPLDGAFDKSTLVLVEELAEGSFVVLSVEDLIADRMGQYASGTAKDRLEQAQKLFDLHPELDLDYLARRISEETFGDYDINDLYTG